MAEADAPRVGGILLAAGGSARMGRPKQLVEFEGMSLIRRAAASMAASLCQPRAVVLGSDADLCRKELNGLEMDICVNGDWESGMSSSIRTGLSFLLETYTRLDAVIITLCDQPNITTDIINDLIAEYRRIRPPVIASEYNGVSGVPALFSRDMFTSILKLEGDRGARNLILAAGDKAICVSVPEAAFDIDSPEDLDRQIIIK